MAFLDSVISSLVVVFAGFRVVIGFVLGSFLVVLTVSFFVIVISVLCVVVDVVVGVVVAGTEFENSF